jgi:hypothetical protein
MIKRMIRIDVKASKGVPGLTDAQGASDTNRMARGYPTSQEAWQRYRRASGTRLQGSWLLAVGGVRSRWLARFDLPDGEL